MMRMRLPQQGQGWSGGCGSSGFVVAALMASIGMSGTARGLAIPRSAVITSSVHMRHNMLVTGGFVAMLPSAMLRFPTYRGSLTALPIELPETRKPIGLITLKRRDLSPVAKLFARCAREVVRPLVIEK